MANRRIDANVLSPVFHSPIVTPRAVLNQLLWLPAGRPPSVLEAEVFFPAASSFAISFPISRLTLNLFLDRDGTHPVTSVVILSHYFTQSVLREGPRPASSFRHPDRNPVTACPEGRRVTPLLSHSCKCPLSQLLSFDILANARGVGGATCIFSTFQRSQGTEGKSFNCNTCGSSRKCCKQTTYGKS
jgi:hypothetical protein